VTPIREAVTAAAHARLAAVLTGVTVERVRRAPPDLSELPLVVVAAGDMTADEEQSPGETFWRIGVTVTGHAMGGTDLAAEQALSELHARVVAAMQGHDLGAGVVDALSDGATFEMLLAEDSDTPAGAFEARFTVLAVAPSGNPYAA
jgi:hypothetical protein